jgi:hypothetical protein
MTKPHLVLRVGDGAGAFYAQLAGGRSLPQALVVLVPVAFLVGTSVLVRSLFMQTSAITLPIAFFAGAPVPMCLFFVPMCIIRFGNGTENLA